ncbi:hypothetical protein BKA70DRAFT_123260 [Coprinopsis sp. MPI-PUGE-AT-0042]|nr:hypothetical protein BKA70DRAFT_123260 [Coprinopsis sp. MPI-PUGE-AT-0042]
MPRQPVPVVDGSLPLEATAYRLMSCHPNFRHTLIAPFTRNLSNKVLRQPSLDFSSGYRPIAYQSLCVWVGSHFGFGVIKNMGGFCKANHRRLAAPLSRLGKAERFERSLCTRLDPRGHKSLLFNVTPLIRTLCSFRRPRNPRRLPGLCG